MASVKLTFSDKKIYKDGTSPIFIRFLVDRKKYTKKVISIKASHFDSNKMKAKSSAPNYKKINLQLSKAEQEAKNYLVQCQIEGKKPDPNDYFNGTSGSLLLDHIQAKMLHEKNRKKYRTSQRWETSYNKVKEHDPDIKIEDIDLDWIIRYNDYLTSVGNNPNTRARELQNIKKFARDAFIGFTMPSNKSQKDKLNIEELKIMESAKFEGGKIQMSLHMFLFAVYNRGMRVHNVLTLKPSNIKDGRLIYTVHKGISENRKVMNIELSQKSIDIIELYKGKSEYIFPMLKMKESNSPEFLKHIDIRNSVLRKHLKIICERLGINKKISMHSARHSFAHIADVKGVPVRVLQDLLGHSKRETTEIYIKALRNDNELDDSVRDLF